MWLLVSILERSAYLSNCQHILLFAQNLFGGKRKLCSLVGEDTGSRTRILFDLTGVNQNLT
jgi:hypothetical protein